MTGQPFTLVTSADAELKQHDALAGEWGDHPNGARGRLDHLVLLTFVGIPSNRLQQRTKVERVVGLALPDVVELRGGLDKMISAAVDTGLLVLP